MTKSSITTVTTGTIEQLREMLNGGADPETIAAKLEAAGISVKQKRPRGADKVSTLLRLVVEDENTTNEQLVAKMAEMDMPLERSTVSTCSLHVRKVLSILRDMGKLPPAEKMETAAPKSGRRKPAKSSVEEVSEPVT